MTLEKNSFIEMTRFHKYQFFLFCKPYLLVLDDDSIIDANIEKSLVESNNDDLLVIVTEDVFFHENLKIIKETEFSVVLQTFDLTDNFVNQIELWGEEINIESNKVILKFETMSINRIYPSVSPYWIDAIDLYKKERVSYLRNKNIETLLS